MLGEGQTGRMQGKMVGGELAEGEHTTTQVTPIYNTKCACKAVELN